MPWPCEGVPSRSQTALQPSLLQLVTDLCGRRLMVVRRQFAILDVAYRLFQGAGEIDAVRPLSALDFELRAAIQADADSHLLDAHHDSPVSFRSVALGYLEPLAHDQFDLAVWQDVFLLDDQPPLYHLPLHRQMRVGAVELLHKALLGQL